MRAIKAFKQIHRYILCLLYDGISRRMLFKKSLKYSFEIVKTFINLCPISAEIMSYNLCISSNKIHGIYLTTTNICW